MKKIIHILILGIIGCCLYPMIEGCLSFSDCAIFSSSESLQTDSSHDRHVPSGQIRAIGHDSSNTEGVLQDAEPFTRILSNRNNNRVRVSHGRNRNYSYTFHRNGYENSILGLNCNAILFKKLSAQIRQETSPFVTSASSHYYVYALRQILC